MTIQIKHAFISLKGDGTDATQVQPSNWNAAHTTSMASGNVIGRLTAGAGQFEEIPISAYMAGLLNTADQATLAGLIGLAETGDVKYTFKSVAASGWVLIPGGATASSIGNAVSGATLRANADCLNLFTVLYNSCSDTVAPVSGGRTGNATNDFNSGKRITLPALAGRSPIGAGAATGGTSARVIGTNYGAETVALATTNLPPYTPAGSVAVTVTSTSNQVQININGGDNGNLSGATTYPRFSQGTLTSTGTGVFTGTAQGGASTPFGILHPVTALNVMVKL